MTRPHIAALRACVLAAALGALPAAARTATAAELTARGQEALDTLYASNAHAKILGAQARAVLVFPRIVRGGLLVGGERGEGVLFEQGEEPEFYSITALSAGLQAGFESHSYAMFFITGDALSYLDNRDGWAVGTGPAIVLMDEAFAGNVNTATLDQNVYAVMFDQEGLMGAQSLEGSKIDRITPEDD